MPCTEWSSIYFHQKNSFLHQNQLESKFNNVEEEKIAELFFYDFSFNCIGS